MATKRKLIKEKLKEIDEYIQIKKQVISYKNPLRILVLELEDKINTLELLIKGL